MNQCTVVLLRSHGGQLVARVLVDYAGHIVLEEEEENHEVIIYYLINRQVSF